MQNRLKELRKALGMTQQEFADKLNIKRNTIANYEVGRNEPIDAVLALICREFNVSVDWLKHGKGEMFIPVSRDDEIAIFAADIIRDPEDSFRRRLLGVLSQLTSDQWELLADIAEKLAEKKV